MDAEIVLNEFEHKHFREERSRKSTHTRASYTQRILGAGRVRQCAGRGGSSPGHARRGRAGRAECEALRRRTAYRSSTTCGHEANSDGP